MIFYLPDKKYFVNNRLVSPQSFTLVFKQIVRLLIRNKTLPFVNYRVICALFLAGERCDPAMIDNPDILDEIKIALKTIGYA